MVYEMEDTAGNVTPLEDPDLFKKQDEEAYDVASMQGSFDMPSI